MAQKPLADATRDELYKYATTYLGLDIHHAAGAPRILATMQQAGFDKEMIEVDEPETPVEAEGPFTASPAHQDAIRKELARLRAIDTSGMTERERMDHDAKINKIAFGITRRINIHANETAAGREAVFLSVNDRDFLINRGIDVDVPEPVVKALEHAEEYVYDVDSNGAPIDPPRRVKKYPFSVIA